jgi:hypothetical protein
MAPQRRRRTRKHIQINVLIRNEDTLKLIEKLPQQIQNDDLLIDQFFNGFSM